MTTTTRAIDNDNLKLIHGMAFGAFLLAAMPAFNTLAQGLDDDAVEAIVGSEVATEKAQPESVAAEVIAAINESGATVQRVQKLFSVSDFHVVFLGSAKTGNDATKINAALEENAEAVDSLREAIEGSSVFYTALDAQGVDVENVVSASVSDDKVVTVYIFGDAP